MVPGVQDITIIRGADFDFEFGWAADGRPVNLTGYIPLMRLIPDGGGDPIDLTPTGNKCIISDPITGEVTTKIQWSETEAYVWGKGRHYVMLQSPAGNKLVLLRGAITVQAPQG